MSDSTPTGKVVARQNKNDSDTARIDVSMLAKAWRVAKDNPIVLVIAALLSGGGVGVGGGQTTVAEILQQAQWWQIALSVIGFGVLSWMSGVSKTLTKILARLERGDQRMTNTEYDVRSLNDWRKREIEERVIAAQSNSSAQAQLARKQRSKGSSEGSFKPQGA